MPILGQIIVSALVAVFCFVFAIPEIIRVEKRFGTPFIVYAVASWGGVGFGVFNVGYCIYRIVEMVTK